MIIVNLNIRGLRGWTKASYIRNIIAKEGEQLLCLQEVKAFTITDSRCFSLWGDNKVGWILNEGESGAGSTLSIWHKDAFDYERHVVGRGYITIFGQHIVSKCHCAVINIYASCNLPEKESLWEEVSNIRSAHQNLAWCFCGDFNVVDPKLAWE